MSEEKLDAIQALIDELKDRQKSCATDGLCQCETKDCYHCGFWHNCEHTTIPTRVLEKILSAKEDEVVYTPNTAPLLTIAFLGHPGNGIVIQKTSNGWFYINTMRKVDDEDFRAGWYIIERKM